MAGENGPRQWPERVLGRKLVDRCGHGMASAVKNHLAAGFFVAAIALAGSRLWACSVPVFRYALERWDADPYQATLFYRGDLLAEQQALVERLQAAGPGKFANVQWRLVDVNGAPDGDSDADSDGRLLQRWESQSSPELPWLVVRSPATGKEVWSGKLTSPAIERLFDSPMRQEIAKRLLSGQTAVWVLLEGASDSTEGDAEGRHRSRDEAALALLKQCLAEEQAQLELPEIEEVDIQQGLIDIDPEELKITFTVLPLSRGDPREQTLARDAAGHRRRPGRLSAADGVSRLWSRARVVRVGWRGD